MKEHCGVTWPHKAHGWWQQVLYGMYVYCPGTDDASKPRPTNND